MRRRRSGGDAFNVLSKAKAASITKSFGRSVTLPSHPGAIRPWQHLKGIMKVTTLDESLHSRYGSDSSAVSSEGKTKVRIKFENIEIREYARTVGDNPSVSSGPPVTISWEYNPNTTVLSIEEYEKARPIRRTQSEMILPRSIRVEMLRKEWDVSQQQIARAVRSGVRAKNQRRTTLGNLGKTEKVEEMIEGATKKLLKTLLFRKGTSQRARELGEEMQKVNGQRAQIVLKQEVSSEFDGSNSSCPWGEDLQDESVRGLVELAPEKIVCEKSENTGPSQVRFDSAPSRKDLNSKTLERRQGSASGSRVFSAIAEQADRQAERQSTGESASQIHDAGNQASRRVITAVEPEDEIPVLRPESRKGMTIDC